MRLATASALLALATLGLAACETVSPAERAASCQTIDWREYGRNDGQLGVPAAERTDLFARCRELGHAPDLAAYEAGRAEGLTAFCTLENGYEAGRTGRPYRDVCPSESEIAFLQGYEQGRRDHRRDYRHGPRISLGFGFGSYHYPHYPWWRDRDHRRWHW